MVQGGAVKVDGEKIADVKSTLGSGSYLLQSGKRKAAKIRVP